LAAEAGLHDDLQQGKAEALQRLDQPNTLHLSLHAGVLADWFHRQFVG